KNTPEDPNPRRSLVAALSAQGRLEDALEECRILKQLPTASLGDEITYARLWISKSIRSRQSVEPRWDELGNYLNKIRSELVKKGKDGSAGLIQVDLLRVEVKVFQSEAQRTGGNTKEADASFKEAWNIMTEAKNAAPDKVELWISQAMLAS